jgi:hypothetical protein
MAAINRVGRNKTGKAMPKKLIIAYVAVIYACATQHLRSPTAVAIIVRLEFVSGIEGTTAQ